MNLSFPFGFFGYSSLGSLTVKLDGLEGHQEVLNASVQHPTAHHHQGPQESHEVLVIVRT